jgi:hypothetical protein
MEGKGGREIEAQPLVGRQMGWTDSFEANVGLAHASEPKSYQAPSEKYDLG